MLRYLAAVLIVVTVGACAADGDPWSPSSVAAEWERTPDSVPPSGISVSVGDDIQSLVEANEPGATFVLESGVHRLGQISPKRGQTFVGSEDAVLSGAVVVDGFRPDGDVWVAEGVALGGEERGNCRKSHPACKLPEDMFVDDVLVQRVLTQDEVNGESWFGDPATGRVVIGFDPSGSVVEISVLPFAFGGEAEGVSLIGLIIEKYASPGQRGAVAVGREWTIINSEIRQNHAVGIKTASGLTLEGSYIHHNGQFAMSGGGVGVTISGNEISHNGVVGYNPGWAAGGTKFVRVTNLVVVGNYVHSNWGPGLWTDAGLEGTLYADNRVVNNEHAGIKHEISGSAEIRGNTVTGNGFGQNNDLRGPGILIRESGPVDVTGNTLSANADVIVLLQDNDRENVTGYVLAGIRIEDNDLTFDGGRMGYLGDLERDFAAEQLIVRSNVYRGETGDLRFVVRGSTTDFGRWVTETGDDSSTSSAEGS